MLIQEYLRISEADRSLLGESRTIFRSHTEYDYEYEVAIGPAEGSATGLTRFLNKRQDSSNISR